MKKNTNDAYDYLPRIFLKTLCTEYNGSHLYKEFKTGELYNMQNNLFIKKLR